MPRGYLRGLRNSTDFVGLKNAHLTTQRNVFTEYPQRYALSGNNLKGNFGERVND